MLNTNQIQSHSLISMFNIFLRRISFCSCCMCTKGKDKTTKKSEREKLWLWQIDYIAIVFETQRENIKEKSMSFGIIIEKLKQSNIQKRE